MSAADDRLTAILARAEAATEGPWARDGLCAIEGSVATFHRIGPGVLGDVPNAILLADKQVDADFAAASRQDVPDLVAALRAVLDVHVEHESAYEISGYFCAEDSDDWPCPTVRAIESTLGGGAA